MKILQVVKTNRGAAWAFNQAKHLKDIGVETVTVLPDDSEGYAEKYKENGMEVVAGNWSLPVTRPWQFFSRAKKIRQMVKEIAPDIIHLHFVTNVLMARLALRFDKTPRLFQVPGPLHLENKITSFAERFVATKADFWAGACEKTCAIYKDKGISPERVHLAYYGVPPKNANNTSKNILHSEFNIPDDAKIVAMVSYFYKPKKLLGQARGLKGHEDFIDAMKIVMEKHSDVIPVIIGNAWDGAEEYEKTVKEYAREILGGKAVFTGYRSDVYDIYPEIDIVVHPSHSENLGGAAESLMLGVPTISSDVGGFPDIVIPSKTGCLVKAKNPDDLAEKIIWSIENHEQMKSMASEGQTYVTKLLDLNNTAAKICEIYSKIEK